MSQNEANLLSLTLTQEFLSSIRNKTDTSIKKSVSAINYELKNLKKENSKETQEMIDTRMSIIFQEISEMIDNSGEGLFR